MSLEENDVQENTAHPCHRKRQEKQQRTVSQKPREEESGQHSQTRQDSSDAKTGTNHHVQRQKPKMALASGPAGSGTSQEAEVLCRLLFEEALLKGRGWL